MSAPANRRPASPDARILLVIAFVFDLPYKAVRGAHDAGYTVHVLGQGTASGFQYSLACAGYRTLAFRPGRDPLDLATEEIGRHATDVGACAVIPGDTVATRLLIAIRERLPVATCLLPTASLFDTFNDKWLFFQFCRQIGVRVPESRTVDCPAAVLDALADGSLALPLVVKPLQGMASVGVHILHHAQDAQRLADQPHALPGPLLIQRFIEGTDRGVSVIAKAGTVLAYAAQTRRGRRYDFTDSAQLRGMAERIVAASGFEGAANFDAVQETATGDCYLVECNPRFWFSMFALLGAGLNVVATSLTQERGAGGHPATVTRPMVPLGRAAVADLLGLSWTPALFASLRYYLRDIPGVLCGHLPRFQNRNPRHGDIPYQMRQLADLCRQTSAPLTPAE